MNTKENAGVKVLETPSNCPDRQKEFVETMQELLKTAIDNNDLRHEMAKHSNMLTAHESRIVVLEVAGVTTTENVDKVLKHLETALSAEDQARLLGYLDKFETGKEKFTKWYLIACTAVIIAIMAGFPMGEIMKAAGKKLILLMI